MKSWSIGVIGLAGLAAIVAGAYSSPEALLAVAVLTAAGVGVGWPHFLGIPARKTLAALIGLPGVGSAVAATYLPAPGFLDWTPSFIAAGVMAVFVMQLIRGTGQAQRLESTLGSLRRRPAVLPGRRLDCRLALQRRQGDAAGRGHQRRRSPCWPA